MQTNTKFKIALIGPEDQCGALAVDLWAHMAFPLLKSTGKSLAFEDCVKFFTIKTSMAKRKILTAMFDKLGRHKGIIMPSTEDAITFTQAFPDVLWMLEVEEKKHERCHLFKSGQELSIELDPDVLVQSLMNEWDIKNEHFVPAIMAPFPVIQPNI